MGLFFFFFFSCRPNGAPHFYLKKKNTAQVLLIMLTTVRLCLGVPGSRYAGHRSRGLVYYFSPVVLLRGGGRDAFSRTGGFFFSLTRAHKLTGLLLAL